MNKSYRGSHFYDQEQNFKNYLERRNWQENANDTIEKPIIMDLIDKVESHDILDLGCGTGAFGNKLLELGAKSYTGIEGSVKMFEASKTVLSQPNARVVHATIEEWDVPEESYHTVVSRLAFHYLSDIDEIFHKVQHALVRGGSFIFSVEHPVMTSSYGLTRPEGLKQDWIVDRYFYSGMREHEWLGGTAVKYHRTVEDYFKALKNAGFIIDNLKESKPREEHFHNIETFKRRMRIPLFLFFKAQKTGGFSWE